MVAEIELPQKKEAETKFRLPGTKTIFFFPSRAHKEVNEA
jgi:hypothetical protein